MMRIHTDELTMGSFFKATGDLPGVYLTITEHGSRSHARAFEVSLEGNGYRKNTGKYGAGDEFGATWDEWGVFLSRIFDLDPRALAGSAKYPAYDGRNDFHIKTADRFESLLMPTDTHKRHTWRYAGPGTGVWRCVKCSAEKRL